MLRITQIDLEIPKVVDFGQYSHIVHDTFNDVDEIGCLILNGEQPLFDELGMIAITDVVISNKIKLGYFITFSIPSVVLSNRSLMLLQKLYDYCENKDRCSVIINDTNFDENYFNFDAKIREKFEFINNRKIEYDKLFDKTSVFCLNGCNIDGNAVINPISISENGELFMGRNIPKNHYHHFNCGNVINNGLKILTESHKKIPSDLQELEIPIKANISFSQYWENLSEDKRGDWFGYVFTKMFDRNFPGYGLYQVVKDNPGLSKLKGFEEIVTILGLESNVPPPWIIGDEIKWEEQVKCEFLGYAKILRDMMYNRGPILEMIDIYYCDLPYKAQIRLKNLIDKFINSSKTEIQNA